MTELEIPEHWKERLFYLEELDAPLLPYAQVLATQEWSSRTFTYFSMKVWLGLSSGATYGEARKTRSVWVDAHAMKGHITLRFKPKLVSPDVLETIHSPQLTPKLCSKIADWIFSTEDIRNIIKDKANVGEGTRYRRRGLGSHS